MIVTVFGRHYQPNWWDIVTYRLFWLVPIVFNQHSTAPSVLCGMRNEIYLPIDLAQKSSDLIRRIWWKLKFETSSLRMCIACLLTFDLRGNDMLNVDFGFFKGLSVQRITQLDIVSSWYGDSFGWESQAQNDIFFMWIWLISYCDYCGPNIVKIPYFYCIWFRIVWSIHLLATPFYIIFSLKYPKSTSTGICC